MSRFWDFVKTSPEPMEGKLPLIHATDLYHFRDIQRDQSLEPSNCEVYRGEKLLYFFYGRPSYRVHSKKDTVTAKALLPVCLVLSRKILSHAVRIMPFDSGAFDRKMMHPPMHDAMRKEDFELTVSTAAPMRMVKLFYEDEHGYYHARPKPVVDGYDSFSDLEVDSYCRLLHHRANIPFDDRVTAIEVQVGKPINLNGQVHAVILPKPFLDRDGIVEQIESWSAISIPYNVKEEFVPSEIQGSIFDKLTDYLAQYDFLRNLNEMS